MEEIKKVGSDEYTVNELMDKLIADDSWEKNPHERMEVIMMLKFKFANA